MSEKILIIDDDDSFREVLKYHLDEEGFDVEVAPDGAQGLIKFRQSSHALVITDLKMPGMDGIAVLNEIKKRSSDTLVIVVTAFGDVETVVQAMKSGAFDFVPKPFDRDYFKLTVRKALDHFNLKVRVRDLEKKIGSSGKEIIHQSPEMQKLIDSVDRVAESQATVVVLGESGTGKELVARRIHDRSDRSAGPFVAINCAAIPRDLIESELFGHAKGAFTGAVKDRAGKFEQANGGSILLDEITDLPLDLQPRLLRVLQERVVDVIGKDKPVPVDVRVIASTNQDIGKAVKDGKFREDLYFRLNVFPVQIPPLRGRISDISILAEHFLARYGKGKTFRLSPGLLQKLESYTWPGNVRELENICHRLALQAVDDQLTEALLPDDILKENISSRICVDPQIELPAGGVSLPDLEKQIIIKALEKNRFNQSRTAKFLGIPRHVLLYRLGKFNIDIEELR